MQPPMSINQPPTNLVDPTPPNGRDNVRPPEPQETEDPVEVAMRQHPGHWFAWNEATRQILGIANTYAEAMKYVTDLDDDNVCVDMAPGFHPDVLNRPFVLEEGESPNILDDIEKLIPNPTAWLDTPNIELFGQTPRQLIGTPEES